MMFPVAMMPATIGCRYRPTLEVLVGSNRMTLPVTAMFSLCSETWIAPVV